MNRKNKDQVIEQYRLGLDPALYKKIRELWKHHSICEDNRDVDGILTTLTPDCCYAIANTNFRWDGKDGARAFYRDLLTAIPDAKFDLQAIVIGPQGVFEEAILSGTHQGNFLHYAVTGRSIETTVGIYFPWDSRQQLFTGERVYLDLDRDFGVR